MELERRIEKSEMGSEEAFGNANGCIPCKE